MNRSEFACALDALQRRDFTAARRELDALLDRDDWKEAERAFLLNKRGVARIALDEREAAREDFEAALEAQARYPPALTNLGNLLIETGQLNEAIAHYERAIESDGEYAVAHFNLGVAYKRAGRIEEGVRAMRHAQRLEQRANVPRSFRPLRSR
jgi:tetratricopeptide (TPR) repeat protein